MRQRKVGGLILAALYMLISSSCTNLASRGGTASRSFTEIQFSDIEELIDSDPLAAYREIGRFVWRHQDSEDEWREGEIQELAERAKKAIFSQYQQALEEADYHRTLQLARSLLAIDGSDSRINYAQLLKTASRGELEAGNYLAAALYAQKAIEYGPLEIEHYRQLLQMFLEKEEWTNAHWIIKNLAENIEKEVVEGIETELLDRALKPVEAADLIKGIATVWVDRGLKIEKGNAILDRVIGSAFFISSSGLMITNYHVIDSLVDPEYEGYARLYVRLGSSSSTRIPAKVLAWDPLMDLALIQTNIKPEHVYSVFDLGTVAVGTEVLAIGSPAGLEKTVTRGIVSALGRRLLESGAVFQLDAAVNQGNSGGPAVDSAGRLVGIVFAGIPMFQGLNFALPAEKLLQALPALLKEGPVCRPWLGIATYESAKGLECAYISPFSPAAALAIGEGAYILSINSHRLPREEATVFVQDYLYPLEEGELVRLELDDGSSRVLALEGRPKKPGLQIVNSDSVERALVPLLGMAVSVSRPGVFKPEYLVQRVFSGSMADEAGISELDNISINNFSWDKKNSGGYIDMRVKRRKSGYIEANIRLPFSFYFNDLI